jgi:hypothetical protein
MAYKLSGQTSVTEIPGGAESSGGCATVIGTYINNNNKTNIKYFIIFLL